MLIFQRMVTLQGPPEEAGVWAVEMTQLVNDRTDLEVSLWQGLFGVPLGSFAWTTRLPSLTALEAANDTLMGDQEYLAKVAEAGDWITAPGEDALVRVAHIAGGDYVRPEVGTYAETTLATPAPGRMGKAMGWGVEITDLVSNATHASALFGSNGFGEFGQLAWIGLFESAAAFDSAEEILAKDESYVQSIDSAGDLFQPGSARRSLARRIA